MADESNHSDPPAGSLSSLMLSVYLPALLFSTGWGMVVPIIPLFARQMGSSLATVGLIVTMRGIGTFAMDIPAGLLVASLGNQRTLVLSSLGVVLTALLTGITGGIVPLGILTFFLGGFQAIWLMSRLNYVRQAVAVHQRGRALSIIGGTARIGSFAGPIIGGYVGQYFGLSDVYFVQGGVALVALVLIVLTRRHFRSDDRGSQGYPTLRRLAMVAVAHRRILITGGLVMLTLGVLRSSRQILFPLWGSSIGLDVGSIGLILGVSSGIELLIFYPAGLIMDRMGRKWALIPCLLIFSLSFFLLPIAGAFPALLVISLVAGLGNGFGSGIVMTLGADFAPDEVAGEFLGLWRLIGDVGTASGPAAAGAIADAMSLAISPLFAAVAGLAGAAIMFFFIPETRASSKPTAKRMR